MRLPIDHGGVCQLPISFGMLPTGLQNSLRGVGITDLNYMQELVVSTLISKTDLVLSGGFKQGRTTALIIGILATMVQNPRPRQCDGPRALIVLSTREAAMETYHRATSFAAGTGLLIQVIVGRSQDPITHESPSKYDLVIATPGKVLDAISKGQILPARLQHLAFDEAHEVLGNTGCGNHIRAAWKFMPKDTSQLSRIIISNVALKNTTDFTRANPLSTLRVLGTGGKWQMRKVVTTPDNKPNRVLEVIQKVESKNPVSFKKQFIIFVPMLGEAERAMRVLSHCLHKDVDIIHSKRSNDQRLQVIEDFNRGDLDILVSCRIAASGITLDRVSGVIFYDTTVAWQLMMGTIHKLALQETGQCFVLYDSEHAGDLERADAICSRYEALHNQNQEADTDEHTPRFKYSLNNNRTPTRRIVVKKLPFDCSVEDVKSWFPWNEEFEAAPAKRRHPVTGKTGYVC